MTASPVLRDDDAAMLIRALMPALQSRNRQEIVRIVSALIDGRARLGRRWIGMAQVMSQTGEFDYAAGALDLLLTNASGDAAIAFNAAVMFAAMGRVERAITLVNALPSRAIPLEQREHFLGTAASGLGRKAEALVHFRAALEVAPHSGQIWHAFSVEHRFRKDDADLARLKAAVRAPTEGDEDRAMLLYAHGKALGDVGRHDESFAAFQSGAQLMRSRRGVVADGTTTDSDATIARWTPQALSALPQGPFDPAPPIFVFGLPRSGTTLVEQILASHSRVVGGGENDAFRHVLDMLGDVGPDDIQRWLTGAGRDIGMAGLARFHRHLLAQRFGPGGQVVDKALGGSHLIGLIACLFPNAPLVLVRRDPLDCAWSILRTYFVTGQDWSWSQTDIAAHMLAEERIMAHWQAVLGDRLHILSYEDLARNPDQAIRALLAACDLPFEPATLTPHRTARAVTTASVVQVRQPISAKAIGAAEPYRRHLQPFIDVYGYRLD